MSRSNPYSVLGTLISEPRIDLIRRQLQELLEVVELEREGELVEVDGFRLRHLEDWKHPLPPLSHQIWNLSNRCNLRCPFCYERGNPPNFPMARPSRPTSLEEVRTRLRHFDAERGMGIFQNLAQMAEPLCHPDVWSVVRALRRAEPEELLIFVTNGTKLTEAVVAELAELKPLYLNLSLNCADPARRREVLGDRHPEIALGAPALLQRAEIPYLGSLIAWPSFTMAELEETIRFLADHGAAVIRVSMSGHSRYLSPEMVFDPDTYWPRVVELVESLRHQIPAALLLEPFHYWRPTLRPLIAGVIQGSPAQRAGLRGDDLILAVDGTETHTIHQARSLVAARHARRAPAVVTVERDGARREVRLSDDDLPALEYPYSEVRSYREMYLGLILWDNLKFSQLVEVLEIMRRRSAHRALLCTSKIMRPVVEEMLSMARIPDDIELILTVPENRYFGGSIVLGDLLVVSDFVAHLRREVPRIKPDLALIPSSPFSRGGWKRDLCGVPFVEIERRVGLPVELIETEALP